MRKIQEGQPFYIILDCADTPAKLEKLFRSIRKMLPKNGRIFSVMQRSGKKKLLEEKLSQVIGRYCDTVYYAPCGSSVESQMVVLENAFRKADFGDCVLILGKTECSAAEEAARQVAYELDLI